MKNRIFRHSKWIPKLHKFPDKQHYIAGSVKCSTKTPSQLLTSILSTVKTSKPGFKVTVTLDTEGVMLIRCGFCKILKICYSTYNQGVSPHAIALKHLYITIPHWKLKDISKELVFLKRMANVSTNTLP